MLMAVFQNRNWILMRGANDANWPRGKTTDPDSHIHFVASAFHRRAPENCFFPDLENSIKMFGPTSHLAAFGPAFDQSKVIQFENFIHFFTKLFLFEGKSCLFILRSFYVASNFHFSNETNKFRLFSSLIQLINLLLSHPKLFYFAQLSSGRVSTLLIWGEFEEILNGEIFIENKFDWLASQQASYFLVGRIESKSLEN